MMHGRDCLKVTLSPGKKLKLPVKKKSHKANIGTVMQIINMIHNNYDEADKN
jgi:hypothetical protein